MYVIGIRKKYIHGSEYDGRQVERMNMTPDQYLRAERIASANTTAVYG